jgi:hypothetical protein
VDLALAHLELPALVAVGGMIGEAVDVGAFDAAAARVLARDRLGADQVLLIAPIELGRDIAHEHAKLVRNGQGLLQPTFSIVRSTQSIRLQQM